MASFVVSINSYAKSDNRAFFYATGNAVKSVINSDMYTAAVWVRKADALATDSDAVCINRCCKAILDISQGVTCDAIGVSKDAIDRFKHRQDSTALRGLVVAYGCIGYYQYEIGGEGDDRYYKRAERYAIDVGDPLLEALCLLYRCNLYMKQMKFVDAAYCARSLLRDDYDKIGVDIRFWARLTLMHIYSHIHADAAVADNVATIEKEGRNTMTKEQTVIYYQYFAEDLLRSGNTTSALELSGRAMRIAESAGISARAQWRLFLQRASILVALKNIEEANLYINYCVENEAIVYSHNPGVEYSTYNLALLRAQIAIYENDISKAEQILAAANFSQEALESDVFSMQYNAIKEQIYCARSNYDAARMALAERNNQRQRLQKEYARMRTKDMEMAYNEDTVIIRQHKALVSGKEDVSNIRRQSILAFLVLIGLILFVFLISLYSKLGRHSRKQKHDIEYNNMLLEEVRKHTEGNILQNKLIANRNEDILASQTYARRIQQGILPRAAMLTNMGVADSFVILNTTEVTLSCFYWFRKIGNRIMIAAANIQWSGVPGAMFSMVGVTLINDAVNRLLQQGSAATLLADVSFGIKRIFPDQRWHDGMGMAVVILDQDTNMLTISSASHDVFLHRNDAIEIVPCASSKLGSGHEDDFSDTHISCSAGDSVFLCTPSVSHIVGGPSSSELGVEGFSNIISRVVQLPTNQFYDAILKELNDWKNGAPLTEETLIVGFTI